MTQEAPIIHQSQMHAPVPMKQFLKNGGIVEGGIPRDQIMGKVMHSGKCVREIDGASDIRSSNKVCKSFFPVLLIICVTNPFLL